MTKIGVPQVFGKNLFNFICYLLLIICYLLFAIFMGGFGCGGQGGFWQIANH